MRRIRLFSWYYFWGLFLTLPFINNFAVRAFILEGSHNSYAVFPKWHHGFENVLTFEFKTKLPTTLLLYTDDGGKANFVEFALEDGRLKFSFRIGRLETVKHFFAHIETDDRRYDDDRWHKVEMFHYWENMRLKVDDWTKDMPMLQNNFMFGWEETNSDVFVGGIPPDYPPDKVTQQPVLFLPRLAGEFRNLVYQILPHGLTSPHILRIEGARESSQDLCQNSVCANGGQCYSTDDGPKCNCNFTNYVGEHCTSERVFPKATFFGNEYLLFELSKTRNGLMSREERLSFRFKTSNQNGMIFYSGDLTDYLHVAISKGAIVATSNLGGGHKSLRIEPTRNPYSNVSNFVPKFADNAWHSVVVYRQLRKHSKNTNSLYLRVAVDDKNFNVTEMPGPFELLTSTSIYVGGAPPKPVGALTRFPQVLETSNFVGCLSKVRFNVSGRVLDFFEMAKNRHDQEKFLQPAGNLSFNGCRERYALEPLQFLDSDSHLSLDGWSAPQQGSIKFQFRTNEADGLILYNGPAHKNGSEFMAFELVDGRLYFVINMGTGFVRTQATGDTVNNGQWHHVAVSREGTKGHVVVDRTTTIDFVTRGLAKTLHLGKTLYVGGMPWTNDAPSAVYTTVTRTGYMGCLRDLHLNNNVVDLAASLSKRSSSQVTLGCSDTLPQCIGGPCKNEGVCREGFQRYVCDCTLSFYEGQTCETEPRVMDFNGEQFVRATLNGGVRTYAEDIVVKFRTTQPSTVLVASTSRKSTDRAELRLSNGVLEYQITIGQRPLPFYLGSELNDDRWHTAVVKRRDKRLDLFVDKFSKTIGEMRSDPLLQSDHLWVLEYDYLWAGLIDGDARTASLSLPAFQGQMAAFVFNRYDVFQIGVLGKRGTTDEQQNNGNALPESSENVGHAASVQENPVYFSTHSAFVQLASSESTSLMSASSFRIAFHFRTFNANGIILYSRSEKSNDYLAVELRSGKLIYVFNTGDGPQTMQSNRIGHLNDYEWHSVVVRKLNDREHALNVDGSSVSLKTNGHNRLLNLEGPLYVGGVDSTVFRRSVSAVQSRHGFNGCISAFDINGAKKRLLNDAVGVKAGCPDAPLCGSDSCSNGGTCTRHPNKIACDCRNTSFDGPRCEEESTSYKFGPLPGLITFDCLDKSRISNHLIFGVRTNQTSEAVILRATSSTSDDYLYVKMKSNGTVFVVFDVGSGRHTVGDEFNSINDGLYHVVKFHRNGRNSVFQLDSHPERRNFPQKSKNKELETFNTPKIVEVGGRRIQPAGSASRTSQDRYVKRRSLEHQVSQPFVGILSGLNFNNFMILDNASRRDPSIKIEGDVVNLSSAQRRRDGPDDHLATYDKQPNPLPHDFAHSKERGLNDRTSSAQPSEGDDIVISGNGSGSGDGDDCCETTDPTATDDLITPVATTGTSTGKPFPRPNPNNKIKNGTNGRPADGRQRNSTPASTSDDVDVLLPNQPRPSGTPVKPTKSTAFVPHTSSNEKSGLSNADAGELPLPPRPTITRTSRHTTTVAPIDAHSKATNESSEKKEAWKTPIIAGTAIGLIVMVIVVVFIVFKCRSKSSSSESYSTVDESKQYTTLYSGSAGGPGEAVPSQPPDLSDSKNFISARAANANGFSKTGKKRDVKEWYV